MLILNLLCRRSQFPQLQQRQLLLLSSRVRQAGGSQSQGSCQQFLSQSQRSVHCPRIPFFLITDTRTRTQENYLRTFATSTSSRQHYHSDQTPPPPQPPLSASVESADRESPQLLGLGQFQSQCCLSRRNRNSCGRRSSSSKSSSSSSSPSLHCFPPTSTKQNTFILQLEFSLSAGPVPRLTRLSTRSLHTTTLNCSPPSSSPRLSLTTNYPATHYFNMNSKHLRPGSTCPPLEDGKVRIYNMRFCPFAQRAVLVAIAKGIPHDVVNVNLKEKPEWIFEKNPMGKVPTIELNSKDVLYESLVVSDYLDEQFPNRPLQSPEPFRKAQDRILVETFGQIITSFYKMAANKGDVEELKSNLQKIRETWIPFEKELEKRGTKFFGGADAPGMLDYMIWPWVERLPVLKLSFPDLSDYEKDKKENPRLEEWRQAMKADPAVKEVYITPEQHQRFMISHMAGTPDYDFLAE